MAVSTEKELGEKLKNDTETIEIEGDLAKKVFKIKATGKTAWAIAIGAIAVVLIVVIAALPTGGTSGIIGIPALLPAIGVLGGGTAVSAVLIAASAGSAEALNKLRKYKIVEHTSSKLVLSRK